MLKTNAVENATSYVFSVTDGTSSYIYEWSKQIPEGQTVTEYIQSCKREAELLAQWEIDQKGTPTPIKL